jgi:hypothetical protein
VTDYELARFDAVDPSLRDAYRDALGYADQAMGGVTVIADAARRRRSYKVVSNTWRPARVRYTLSERGFDESRNAGLENWK